MINDLRKTVRAVLKNISGVDEVYYQTAKTDAMYPHIVFYFDGINTLTDDNVRRDVRLYVDVWDRATSAVMCEDITDAVDFALNKKNLPQTSILPTFYLDSIMHVTDEDKQIKHNQLKFVCQTYKR